MSDPSPRTTSQAPSTDLKPETSGAGGLPQPSAAIEHHRTGARLQTERGITRISDIVVSKIAAFATKEIPGVQAMGNTMARAFGRARSLIPGASSDASSQGVAVEVGERQAAIDIDIVVYYGQSVVEVTEAVRANVINRIEGMTGLEVVEVNISVNDLYIEPPESGEQSEGSRAQ